jgi:hypothetical protein
MTELEPLQRGMMKHGAHFRFGCMLTCISDMVGKVGKALVPEAGSNKGGEGSRQDAEEQFK